MKNVDIERSTDGYLNIRSLFLSSENTVADVVYGLFMNSAAPNWSTCKRIFIEFDPESDYRSNLNLLNSIVRTDIGGAEEFLTFTVSPIADNLYVAEKDFSSLGSFQNVGVKSRLAFNARVRVWTDDNDPIPYTGHRNFIKIPYDSFTIVMSLAPRTESGQAMLRCTPARLFRIGDEVLVVSYIVAGSASNNLSFRFLSSPTVSLELYTPGEPDKPYTIAIACTLNRTGDNITSAEVKHIDVRLSGQTNTYRKVFNKVIADPNGLYSASVLDHFLGEVEYMTVFEGTTDVNISSANYLGDNLVGDVVSMIRDYETNELHALVSPDRAGLYKDGKILEFALGNTESQQIGATLDADHLNNLQFGQVGYNENGKFELLSIKKNNWEYDYRNILQRKDRRKVLLIPSKLFFVNNKPFLNSKNQYQFSTVGFVGSVFGKYSPSEDDGYTIVTPTTPPHSGSG